MFSCVCMSLALGVIILLMRLYLLKSSSVSKLSAVTRVSDDLVKTQDLDSSLLATLHNAPPPSRARARA